MSTSELNQNLPIPGLKGISWLQLVSSAPPARSWIQCLTSATRAWTPWPGHSGPGLNTPIWDILATMRKYQSITSSPFCVPLPPIFCHHQRASCIPRAGVITAVASANVETKKFSIGQSKREFRIIDTFQFCQDSSRYISHWIEW